MDITALIQRAELDIVDFGYDIKSELNNMGRRFPYYVMSYLKEGEAVLRIGGQNIVTPAGSVILVRSGELHDHIKTSREDAIFLWWHFNFMISKQVDILRCINLPLMVQVECTEVFEKFFLAYLEAIKGKQSISGIIYKKARALDVLACLLENFVHADETRIVSGIPQHFFDILKDITGKPDAAMSLKKLSDKYRLNPTYISNKFQEYFSLSPIALHKQVVIKAAKEQLLASSMHIGEIAKELGFRDTSAFTRFFSQKAGFSPSEYRNSQTAD